MKRNPRSLLSQVEAALWAVQGGGEASVAQVTEQLGLASTDRNTVRRRLDDLCRCGRADRTRPGMYRPRKRQPGEPDKKEIAWRFLRSRRQVTAEELEEAAGASHSMVMNWLSAWMQLKLVINEAGCRKKPGVYRLIADPVALPEDNSAAYQRSRRQLRKEALVKLDAAFATVAADCPGQGEGLRAIAEARLAVSQLEE